jgi:GNAT superfamily N-acetyltransferase
VVAAEEKIASLPSFFFDGERACPATTWYRSVQARGTLLPVDDRDEKAAALQAMMEKLQPEGGYRPIAAQDPLYRSAVHGLLVFKLRLDDVMGRANLGQAKDPALLAGALRALWARGAPGDDRSIELARRANPLQAPPPFLAIPDDVRAPAGTTLRCWLGEEHVGDAVTLLSDTYWNAVPGRPPVEPARIAQAQRGSQAWVGAVGPDGRLLATARAVSDGAKAAWIYDVSVDEPLRRGGLGTALMRLLLEHPAVRGASLVHLWTKDARGFYERMGFRDTDEACAVPWERVKLTLRRGATPAPAPAPAAAAGPPSGVAATWSASVAPMPSAGP